jgi:chemotaxis protein MotB
MSDVQADGAADTRQHELVIIKRRGDGEEAPHKGGVWKIAHADFMTALMAFFLVMWLITATDDKTITGVANYFNPMRLSEAVTKPKGVFTMEGGEEQGEDSKAEKGADKAKPAKPGKGKKGGKHTDAAMFSEPYETLDEIAAEAPKTAPAPGAEDKDRIAGHNGGEEYRDPFVPDTRHGQFHPGKLGADGDKKAEAKPAGALEPAAEGGDNNAARLDGPGMGGAAKEAKSAEAPAGPEAAAQELRERRGEELKRKIEDIVRESGLAAVPGIDVEATRDGLLISVTDQFNFEMFGIASARPKPELVVVMGKIGEMLAKQPGRIVLRGHTDGRPFRSDEYDNWRLSTARAHMANYMLVRSGVPKDRIERIEGYADRALKVRSDPLAAPNRRIEILLLEEAKP